MLTNHLHSNLKFLRTTKNIKQAEMQAQTGIKRNTWSNWENGISEPNIETIFKIAHFFGIDVGILLSVDLQNAQPNEILGNKANVKNAQPNAQLTAQVKRNLEGKTQELIGEISPFLTAKSLGVPQVVVTDNNNVENIVHVPIKARAGYLIGYGDANYIESLYSYNLPGFKHGTYRSFEVEGQSMKPTLLHRDWVVGQWVESFDDIRENRVHIIVTKNDGILIKRVLNRISDRNKLYLKSDTITQRGEYPTIELDPSDVAEIWYSRIRFSPDFSEPSEVFTRLNNMEIAIHELQKKAGLNPI